MATKTQTIITDDLDGSDNARTVRFAYDGQTYEIDLTDTNTNKMREALAPYIGHARKVTTGTAASKTRSAAATGNGRTDVKAIRAWAAQNNIQVPARGRLPKHVIEQYDQAS